MTNLFNAVGISRLALILISAASLATAETAVVFVPGNALGSFGNPSDTSQPYVAAISVDGPGTIDVRYIGGVVTDCCPNFIAGPNGVTFNYAGFQSPLQETSGISGGIINNANSLLGIFVDRARILSTGFSPVDGTKGGSPVGMLPSDLRFIGSGKVIEVKEAGTLFLGVNDCCGSSNGGGFTVSVMFVRGD